MLRRINNLTLSSVRCQSEPAVCGDFSLPSLGRDKRFRPQEVACIKPSLEELGTVFIPREDVMA